MQESTDQDSYQWQQLLLLLRLVPRALSLISLDDGFAPSPPSLPPSMAPRFPVLAFVLVCGSCCRCSSSRLVSSTRCPPTLLPNAPPPAPPSSSAPSGNLHPLRSSTTYSVVASPSRPTWFPPSILVVAPLDAMENSIFRQASREGHEFHPAKLLRRRKRHQGDYNEKALILIFNYFLLGRNRNLP